RASLPAARSPDLSAQQQQRPLQLALARQRTLKQKTPAHYAGVLFSRHVEEVVQAGGLEPPTSGSTDQRSNQLSYACTGSRLYQSRSKRPEPRCRPPFWQALPA